MKNIPVSRGILGVYLISLSYWIYLAFHSFASDLIGYKDLGYILYRQGVIGYVATGLHREPLYPLLCSLAIYIENLTGITFIHIMAGFSVLILMTTQILTYIILRELKIRPWICFLTLLYLAVSPAITSSAFHILLFCEVITYPFILAIVIAGYGGWRAVKQHNKRAACCYGAVSGIMFMAVTLVKAVFEFICPAYLMVFLAAALYKNKISSSLVCFLAAAGVLFYFPVIGYKVLNKIHNGNFAIADRGPANLYGNVTRRVGPLTVRKYLACLTSVAGENVCRNYFKPQECFFWTFSVSDDLGDQKMSALAHQQLPPQAVTNSILKLSQEKALSNLPLYLLMTATESLRVYFWEASNTSGSLRYIMALLTFFSVLYCCFFFHHLPGLMKHILVIIFFFVAFYSLFAILPRHILPMVPLYLISISYSLNTLLPKNIGPYIPSFLVPRGAGKSIA